jgi:dihydropteroate synthase
MEYHEAADYLESLDRSRVKPGTGATARLLSYLGDPHEGVDHVQVAGSNGKGSTARMLERVLRAAGLDVGLFISPNLNDFREQVRVNGCRVPRSRVVAYAEALAPYVESLPEAERPTHFEALTALALHHFGTEDVDVAVLEVGIGGRLDATSVVDPVASAVTSVSLEHTDLLGETIEEIARDKAQVAPADRPLVTGTTGRALETVRSVSDVATVGDEDADVTAVERGPRPGFRSEVAITAPDWAVETALPLPGAHQATNAGVAATLARQVADVDTATIADGLCRATWPGRFEVVDTEPTVVLDGSHNPGAAATLRDSLGRLDYDRLHVVFGAMGDKDHAAMVDALPPVATAFVTRADTDRAAAVEDLAPLFADRAADVRRVGTVPEATERAVARAASGDAVLVTGSLYTVAEARDRWTRLVVPKERGRRPGGRGTLSGAAFPDTSAADVDCRVLSTNLRPRQAERVARRAESIGAGCHRSAAGAPGPFVATVLSGTVPQLRTLADRLDDDGLGLGHVATQVRAALADGPTAGLGGDGTAVLGVLDVAPGAGGDPVERARAMVAAGAEAVEVVHGARHRSGSGLTSHTRRTETDGGTATASVPDARDRVVPAVESLTALDVPVAVGTGRSAVAAAALDAGAAFVDDRSGFADPELPVVVAERDASVVLPHRYSTPVGPDYWAGSADDVVADVCRELAEQLLVAERVGLDRDQVLVDPGLDAGKAPRAAFELLDRLPELRALGCPLLLGHEGSAMFDAIAGGDSGVAGDDRPPTLAATTMAAERGADVVRVHDVAPHALAVRTVGATHSD